MSETSETAPQPRRKMFRFPDFISVTLADILANGAAIIILMIVITVMIKREEEREQKEKTEEVAVLLSRDLVSSVVMNALPASAPAMLHDYNATPEDRNPRHSFMPILELHEGYVSNYYTDERFTRQELLKKDNALDRYLRSLSLLQAARIRVDIYDIRQFYLAMAVLKDHDIRVRHWHFIGYTQDGGSRRRLDEYLAERTPQELPGELLERPRRQQSEEALSGGTPMDLPQGEIDLGQRPFGAYPYDDLNFEVPGGREGQQGQPAPPSEQAQQPEDQQAQQPEGQQAQQQPDGQSEQGQRAEGSPGQPLSRRFRSARPPSDEAGGQPGPQIELPELAKLLRAMFAYMEQAQQEADAGKATGVAQFEFARDILQSGLLERILQEPADPQTEAFFRQLADEINVIPAEGDARIYTEQQAADVSGQVLAIPFNRSIQRATLLTDSHQHWRTDLPAEVSLGLRISLYPSIYRGLEVPLRRNSFVLMPRTQRRPDEFRWRVLTAVNAARNDFVVAFAYAAIAEDGQLLLGGEENALSLSGYRINTTYPKVEQRSEKWLLLLYGILAVGLLLAIFRRPIWRLSYGD